MEPEATQRTDWPIDKRSEQVGEEDEEEMWSVCGRMVTSDEELIIIAKSIQKQNNPDQAPPTVFTLQDGCRCNCGTPLYGALNEAGEIIREKCCHECHIRKTECKYNEVWDPTDRQSADGTLNPNWAQNWRGDRKERTAQPKKTPHQTCAKAATN